MPLPLDSSASAEGFWQAYPPFRKLGLKFEDYSSADFVAHAGISTFIDSAHPIAHNKIMVIDGHIVITGSFNFTKAAEEHNAENLLVIDDSALAGQYVQNWQEHRQHSAPYQGR
jgi:phosphatidylserine/phosphatidylglycerophosphate/cardiolipin synthase-like enzyme